MSTLVQGRLEDADFGTISQDRLLTAANGQEEPQTYGPCLGPEMARPDGSIGSKRPHDGLMLKDVLDQLGSLTLEERRAVEEAARAAVARGAGSAGGAGRRSPPRRCRCWATPSSSPGCGWTTCPTCCRDRPSC